MKFREKDFATKHSPCHLVPKSTGGRAGFCRVMRSTASLASSWSPHQAEVGPYLASIAFRWRPFDPTGYAKAELLIWRERKILLWLAESPSRTRQLFTAMAAPHPQNAIHYIKEGDGERVHFIKPSSFCMCQLSARTNKEENPL